MLIRQATRLTFAICESHLFRQTNCITKPHDIKIKQNILQISRSISSNQVRSTTLNMEGTCVNKIPVKKPKEFENLTRLTIAKSQQDNREYRGLQLDNGMKVLLVSDPKTDVSAAALSVEVGHMSDPDDLPGLAHFCEHMLFLGTEKYPHENGYAMYISQNSGSCNAATYSHMTKYHFHVASDKLDGALDRFAQFFIAPLFTPSATDREIKAVNSEYEKNLSSDIWRVRQVKKHLAKPNHPYSKFGSGNKMSLCDTPKSMNIDVREELLKFHKKWYSSNIMSLAVIGKESLNELEDMVISKFATIENKQVELPIWDPNPFEEDQYGQKLLVTPVKDIRSLTISFITDDLSGYYKSAPDGYLIHLVGHEAKGSILYELRQRGWCNDLIASHNNTARGFGFFEIVVDLTQDGIEHVDDIVHIVFQYIRMLREEGPKKWIFDECCDINKMHFRFKDKDLPESLVTNVVASMQMYPLEEVLTAPYLINEWEPELITTILNELVPEKCRIIVVSQSLEPQLSKSEPWYGTKYDTIEIDPETIKRWANCERNENLTLPAPNAFIPTDFNLMPLDPDANKNPVVILDTPILRVWHKQDDEFLTPKVAMDFDFSNPMVYSDPLNCNLNRMLVALLKDQLNDYLYDAELTGLKLDVLNTSAGISVNIKGYHHKQHVLLAKVLDHLFDFKVDEKRFDILKEDYIRSLKNFKAEQPYQHAIYYLALILTENAWSKNELLDAMSLVTKERVEYFAKEFFSRLHTECFIFGNATKQRALEISNIINKKLETTNSIILPLLARQMLKKREYKLNNGESYLFENANEFHKTSCAELYLQCGPQTDRSMVMVDLVSQILTEPCYDVLRTKEQLGYIVFCGSRKVNGGTGLRILVQSTRHPSYVEDRIENFIEDIVKKVEEMSLDEFENHKEALANKKLEKAKSFWIKYSQYFNEINLNQYHFDRPETEVAILRKLSKEELLEYMKTHISRDAPERHVLSVHIVSTEFDKEANAADLTNMDRHTKLNDLSAFKSSKELYPVARPHMDIRSKGARSKL